ncbi:MAG TPA: 4-hydroxy-tetrahydrodipicolinate reductase [Xanthobacteraceae bacterium]|nr:4-hydroxy-tetrahydrodipicolinate reductase [Xanthobacteraceae bacterium]
MADLRLLITGAAGRMGRTLIRAIAETPGLMLAGAVERVGASELGEDAGTLAGLPPLGVQVAGDPMALIARADAIIDFSTPEASVGFAGAAAEKKIVHVIGTTGFSAADEQKIEAAARHTVIIKSGNMSLGVNLLAALVKRVAKTLGDDFDIEILEMHHNQKVDAPSGTALLLGKAAAEGRGIALEKKKVGGRDGHTGARKAGDIGFAALRGGSVVGDHSVIFAGPAERIELTHRAEDRMIFARGALAAAKWGKGRKPGLYSMTDVLGLSDI